MMRTLVTRTVFVILVIVGPMQAWAECAWGLAERTPAT